MHPSLHPRFRRLKNFAPGIAVMIATVPSQGFAEELGSSDDLAAQVSAPLRQPAPQSRQFVAPPVAQARVAAPASPSAVVAAPVAPVGDVRPVTQEQFKSALRILKRTLDRVDSMDKKGSSGSNDGSVDLNSIDSGSADAGKAPVGAGAKPTHGFSSVAPNFKVFFDLNLVNRPGVAGQEFAFTNYHSFLFFEILPNPDMQFSFDIPFSKFYELDYQLTPKLQVRAGKIWIPFDDMAPHNIFGGRVSVSRLAPSSNQAFLPDVWADYGVGFKYQFMDTQALSVLGHAYIVNGFGGAGSDPAGGPSYPQFTDVQGPSDNNRDKALGMRVHAVIAGKLGLGLSYYTQRWNSDSELVAKKFTLFGIDGQLRLGAIEFRAGLASGQAEIPVDINRNTSFRRGGLYGEVGYKFGKEQVWKLLGRGGTIQLDDRAISVTDQTIIGGTILRRFGTLELSFEHSRDIKSNPAKINTSYTNVRLVVAL